MRALCGENSAQLPAYPLALSHLAPALSFDVPFNADTLQPPFYLCVCLGFVCVCHSRASAFHWVFVVNRDGSLGFSLSFPPILVRFRPLSENPLKGAPCTGPKPTRRHILSLGARTVLWASQFNADILQLPLFQCAFFFMEPEQLSPTDEILILSFWAAALFIGWEVHLVDFTVRKRGEC